LPKQIKIPIQLLQLYPQYNVRELRAIVNVIWKCKSNKLRQAHIFRIVIPNLGVMRSRANKKPKRRKKTLLKDKKRKRELYRKQELEINNLLF